MKISLTGLKPLKEPPAIPWDPETMSWKHRDDGQIVICGPVDVIKKSARIEVMDETIRIMNVGKSFPRKGTLYVYGYLDDIRLAKPHVQRAWKREREKQKREMEKAQGRRRGRGGMGL